MKTMAKSTTCDFFVTLIAMSAARLIAGKIASLSI